MCTHIHTRCIFRSWRRNKAKTNLLCDRAYRRCETGEEGDDSLFEETDGDGQRDRELKVERSARFSDRELKDCRDCSGWMWLKQRKRKTFLFYNFNRHLPLKTHMIIVRISTDDRTVRIGVQICNEVNEDIPTVGLMSHLVKYLL